MNGYCMGATMLAAITCCCAACAGNSQMEPLVAALRGQDDGARWRASIALGHLGKPAVPALVEALRDPDYKVRIAAANAIRDMGSKGAESVPILAENLSYSQDRELGYGAKEPSLYAGSPSMQVRWCAVAALGHIGPKALPAVPALLAMLRGEYESGLVGPKPGDVYGQKHWRAFELRGAAAWVLQKLGPAAAAQYPQVIPALAAALKEPARMVRLNAAAALRRMGPAAQGAVPALLEALKHEDQYTRIYAALAFTALGKQAAPYLPQLIQCHNTVHLDSLSRKHIRRAIFDISGEWPKVEPDSKPSLRGNEWAALDRRDFLLVVQPFGDSSLVIDPDKLIEAFVTARMANAMTCWPDHTWYNTPPPTADQMKQWGMAMVWYFFTEDIFNPKLERDWGFATLDEYNLALTERILEVGRVLGKRRCLWSVGHEQMDAVGQWANQPDGSTSPPVFGSKTEGYEFYRRWITTSLHKRHWLEYGSTRPGKFYDGWNTAGKATWEFLADHKIDTSPVTMMSGGVSPVLAHASFDILPQIGAYWWECQIDGASLQIGSAYLRGASRQYGKQWLLDASPWSPVHGGPGWGFVDGKWSGGVTDAMQLRTWIYGYLAGASAVLEESSGGTHFRIEPYPHGPSDRPIMTSVGKTAQAAARFCFELCADRGQPYNPVAVLLEHAHGFEPRPHTNFRRAGAWGYMPMSEGEYEIEQFWYAAFPGHSSFPDPGKADPDDPCAIEPLILTESALGDCFDVLTDKCPLEVLRRYPRVITLGGIVVDKAVLAKLLAYVNAGGELVVNAAHLHDSVLTNPAFGCRFGNLVESEGFGDGAKFSLRVLEPNGARALLTDAAGRPVIVVNQLGKGRIYVVGARHNLSGTGASGKSRWLAPVTEFLKRWIEPVWAVRVTTREGAAPQVMLNKLAKGWLVTIGNHAGRHWKGTIALSLAGAGPVTVEEKWEQTTITSVRQAGVVSWKGEVPQYSFRVYRVAAAEGETD
jgi:hypothetical protein